jgi:MOSC domain-containing protein YiiM
MRVLSINVGMPMSHLIDGKEVATGIVKTPATDRVLIRHLGAAGDGQANQPNHGGVDQALSVYSLDHYRFWGTRFGRSDFSYGIFGENLTVTDDMTETAVCIGDVFAIGSATVQVTHPRIPCFRLSHRLSLPLFHQEQLQSGRVGYLLRVLQEGEIAAGDEVTLLRRDEDTVSVERCIAATLLGEDLPDVLSRLDGLPHLSQRWRAQVANRLGARRAPAGV